MTRSHACRIIPRAIRRAVITAASVMFCLMPAWSHELDRTERGWMERGWIYLMRDKQDNEDYDFVLVDPARITNQKIYWDAISHICHPGRDCAILFYLHITFLRYQPDTTGYTVPSPSYFPELDRDSVDNNLVAAFRHYTKSGENILLFSCHTIENDSCY